MKARAAAAPAQGFEPVRGDWRKTNPGYQYSPPTEVIFNGMRCVEIDGGVFSDLLRDARYLAEPKGK